MTKAKLYFTTGDPQELDNLESSTLIISGISTLGITTTTNLTSQTLVVTGISTFTNGPVMVGSGVSTGTSEQRLQVTGGAYVSGSVGIGTTNPQNPLHISGSPGTLLRLDGGTVGTGTRDIVITEFNTDAYGGIIRYDSSADKFTIGTIENSVVKNALNISRASGHITTPLQPSFAASHTNNTLVTGEIVWGTEHFDTGSNYSTSTGRFTAPVAGVYFFRAHTLIQNPTAGEARIAIYKNGAGFNGLRFITVKPANTWWSLICEGHASLAANDYVSIWMEQNPSSIYADDGYNSFSGHLIG